MVRNLSEQIIDEIDTVDELITALKEVKKGKYDEIEVGTYSDNRFFVKAKTNSRPAPAVQSSTENETVYS